MADMGDTDEYIEIPVKEYERLLTVIRIILDMLTKNDNALNRNLLDRTISSNNKGASK